MDGGRCLVLVFWCGSILFSNEHAEKERDSGFTLVVLWLSVFCISLPQEEFPGHIHLLFCIFLEFKSFCVWS